MSLRPEVFEPGPEPFGVLILGLAGNLCFTGGWIAELVARLLWRERAEFFGPIMFSLGLLFSIAISFLPPLLTGFSWLTTQQ